MTYRNVILHRLAGDEMRRAGRRYKTSSPQSELRFRDAIHVAFGRISEAADSCSPFGRRFRWVKLRKFPYIVYFGILSDTEAMVYAVAHEKRRPGYWMRRVNRP